MLRNIFLILFVFIFIIGCNSTSKSSSSGGSNTNTVDDSLPCQDLLSPNCECFTATNEQRTLNGLPKMSFCSKCFSMATEQAADMNTYNYFSHDRPALTNRPAETFSERVTRFIFTGSVAENIALNVLGTDAVVVWMNSSGHRANILNSQYISFSCGYNGIYSVQVFSSLQQ